MSTQKMYPPATTVREAVAEALRAAIAASGASIAKVSEMAGIPRGTLNKYYLSTDRAIPIDTLYAVATALGLEGSDIVIDAERRLARGLALAAKAAAPATEELDESTKSVVKADVSTARGRRRAPKNDAG